MDKHPGFTASGKRKKPDKWANILKAKYEEYNELLSRVNDLVDEQRSLRAKEALLLQVLDILQHVVADAANAQAHSHASASVSAAAGASAHKQSSEQESLLWLAIASSVQQREQEINALYGGLLSSLYPSQRQHNALNTLKLLCSPDSIPQIRSMPEQQLISRLSDLAGKCALQLLREPEELLQVPADVRGVSEALYVAYLEFSTLCMSSMVWDSAKFKIILNANLDTQQPFEEQLPAEHWLNALQQLQLSEEQLHMLSCMHDKHFWTGRLAIKARMNGNLKQQEAQTELLAELLQHQVLDAEQQDTQHAAQEDASTSAAAQGAPSRPAGAACSQPCPSPAKDPTAEATRILENQEVLVEEQGKLLRQWLLLGLHIGIATTCTLSTYQLARFVAAAYPSIPRMDIAMAAYRQQQQQQEKEIQGQRQQQQEEKELPTSGSRRLSASKREFLNRTTPKTPKNTES